MIIDKFNREHNYLRISLTDRCDLRCAYCMPDEETEFAPSEKLMQLDEILALARIFVSEGVNRIRLTGGEPLVRKDAAAIILALGELPVSLHLTTNATRIHHFIDVLKQAGVRTVNISLDTLSREKFEMITRRDHFMQVMKNIGLLLSEGFIVKINVVVMKGVNDKEILEFVNWTRNEPVHIRFIEFMPFEGNHWQGRQVMSWQEILGSVSDHYRVVPLAGEKNATAKSYSISGHSGTVSVISTMSAPFCGTCNRMRLTADGKMKNCLFSSHEADLLGALRNGGPVHELIHQCVAGKAEKLGGQMEVPYAQLDPSSIINRSMIAIGG